MLKYSIDSFRTMFSLGLLNDKKHELSIQWQGNKGEFKLIKPNDVAKLWGIKGAESCMYYYLKEVVNLFTHTDFFVMK